MTDTINVDKLKKTLAEFAKVRDWEKFHSPKNLSMALAGEAAELLEIFQWCTEEESLKLKTNMAMKEMVSQELADIILYAMRLADQLDIALNAALINKIALNAEKYPVAKCKGSAKKYTEWYSSSPLD